MRFLYVSVFMLCLLVSSQHAFARSYAKHKPIAEPQLIPVFQPLVTTYDVYVGGLHLLTADITFQEENGKYHAAVKAHTQGFWYRAFPWDTVLDTTGTIRKDRFIPAEFETTDTWKHHPKEVKLHFDGQGNVVAEFNPPSDDKNRELVTDEQKHGSLDVVTGMLQMLAQVAVDHNCNVTVPVFDGKRRFDITGTDNRMENIDEDDYSAYAGPSRVCDADFKMIAGEWKEKDHIQNGFWKKNDKEEGREPFHIWLASLAPGLPELPVRLQSGSVWGLIIVHLSGWHYLNIEQTK